MRNRITGPFANLALFRGDLKLSADCRRLVVTTFVEKLGWRSPLQITPLAAVAQG